MKRTLVVLFLTIFIFSNTPLRELYKLPLLVEHYLDHKTQVNELSFIEFLEIHYSQNTTLDADLEKDMRLPFKSSTIPVTYNIVAHIEENKIAFLNFFSYEKEILFHQFTSSAYYSSYLVSIWQPPKC